MWLLALLAGPAHAHLEVLIYGPTETYEADAVKDFGGSATVWDAATWKAASASDFEAFHVILIPDGGCSAPTSSALKAAYDSRTTWTSVVRGNIVVGGINPACHASTEPVAEEFLINALSHAGDGGGVPGLVVLGDQSSRDLDFLDAWGSFDIEPRADDTVSPVSSSHDLWTYHYTTTGKDLSGWGDSNAAYVKSWPSGWDVLARNSKGEALVVGFEDCDGDFDTFLDDARCGGTDCDDDDSLVKPGATEYCNGYDDDCDSVIDEDDAADTRTWYRDADSDSWGDASTSTVKCVAPAGYIARKGDCDDSRAASYPGAVEYCNTYDDDCDSIVDEWDAVDASTFWFDADADGYGDPARSTPACSAPSGWVDNDDDCDDGKASTYPGAREVPYDGTDQDCDGSDLCDVDEDGADHPTCGGSDCDDTDDSRYPGATETWYDGVDTDCDGWSDYDADRDGDDAEAYGGTDCDDADPTVYKGAPEISDGKDNDCNGFAEDDDGDGDGLTSEDELILGTDVDDGDYDDDGLSDGEEAGDVEAPTDSDGDGDADVFDDDDDDDGIPTLDEIGDHDWTDPTSEPDDTDGDGLPDHLDDDSDGDGRSDSFEGTTDTDGDGLADFKDVDSDGDGLPDASEPESDTDGDSLVDRLDPDDDGDGLPTIEEGVADSDGDGTPDYLDLDSDDDGHPDAIEGLSDTDGDGVRDSLDLDSDDDGLLDADESDEDSDGDDWPDRLDPDDDGDGLPTATEAPEGEPVDHDEDGLPDHLDVDSDDDGFEDGVEGLVDSDGDGVRDSLDADSEDDGVPDALEADADTDEDGLVDRLDPDDDGDGLRSTFEGTVDTDGDGVPDHRDTDSDGDGKPDATEGYRDEDCDDLRNYVDADDADGPCLPPDPWPELVIDEPADTDDPAEPDGRGCSSTGAANGVTFWFAWTPTLLLLLTRRRRVRRPS